jgi:DNA topoisomerase-1
MSDSKFTAYCVKCKAMRPIKDAQPVYMANGRPGTRGVCPECGTGLFKIGETPAHASLVKPEVTTRKRVDKETRKQGDKETRRQGDKETRRQGDKETRKRGDKETGKRGDKAGVSASKSSSGTVSRSAAHAAPNTQYPISNTHSGKLVIVESPAKARTVGRFLGSGYNVRASVGHVRDLLKSRLSVDVENGFAPTYRVPDEKREVVKTLKAAAAQAGEIYLATDPDREGEAIAWHLMQAAEIPPERTRRVVFHEITKSAIAEAFAHGRDIDMQLVDAQQARRILDRLVGYQVSPLLWDRVRNRLSAGRVQSVALRLIVEREREIAAFVSVEYWTIDADLAQQTTRGREPRPSFLARLVRMRGAEVDLKNEADAQAIVAELEGAAYVVANVKRGERRRRPNPPFTTSTMQQDAAQRLGMTAQRTMRVAQVLYEGIDIGEGGGPVGLITYMRTDSVNVAQEAQAEARGLIAEKYGPEYLPPTPNVYKTRTKSAQEAHEAIRPTSVRRQPATLRDKLTGEQYRLYELIWQRFVASQMTAAVYDTLTIEVEAGQPADVRELNSRTARSYLFRASGSQVKFPGFLAVYSGGAPGPGGVTENGGAGERANGRMGERENGGADSLPLTPSPPLPLDLYPGEPLDLLRLLPEQHFTQPPPRYNEASLVRTLEENGIGRPSTYATIISTILDRDYVGRVDRKLVPTELGFTVNDLLVKHFDSIFNVGFTAGMEEHLDGIARGEEQMVPVLRDFYDFFAPQLHDAERSMEKVPLEPQKTGEPCPECGGDLVIKIGRYGKFVGCANFPTCRFTQPWMIKTGAVCPKDGGDLVERRTKKGQTFYGCVNYPACDFTTWKRPLPQPCPKCKGLLVVANKDWAECIVCHERTKIEALAA